MDKSILVIEDDRVLNELVARQLRRIGHTVTGVSSWTAASTYLSDHEPNLIILDTRLPDVDGHKIISQVAQYHPVIVLTAAAAPVR